MQQASQLTDGVHGLAPSEATVVCAESLTRLLDLHDALCGGRSPDASPTVPLARSLVAAGAAAEAGDLTGTCEACLDGIRQIALLAARGRGYRRHDARQVADDAVVTERAWQQGRIADIARRGV